MGRNLIKIGISFVVILSFSIVFSEEVAKFAYKGKPEDFHQKDMTVPSLMVALSDYQYAHGKKFSSGDTISKPSVMLVIDYSASMLDNDPTNKRVTIPTEVLESIYQKCPDAEVGLSLFSGHLQFDREDDPYSVECPGEPGKYCPLLQLNKQYPPDNKTGYEILKWYLTMRDVFLDYLPFHNVNIDGTHIRAGFNATKHAFGSSNRIKDVHFNIFFSDGEPTDPEGDLLGFVPGKDVATTFTVFFGETIPPCLTDFTKNVKANGYSSNNAKTDLWKLKNINNDTLVNFVLNNIITSILTGGYMMPQEMAVDKGTPATNWHLDSTGFQFPTVFPLLRKVTDFDVDLKYKIRRIKKNTNTGLFDTINTDTLHPIEFNVDIDPAQGALPDSTWDVKKWDRNLGFYFNGNQVAVIEDNMNPLAIRFENDPKDAKYSYTKARIEIRNTSTIGTDIEYVDLSKNGQVFTGTINRTVIADNAQPTQSDGTLQHYQTDNITAVFRNDESPKLVLDTLKITVPFEFAGGVTIEKAFYYDNSADGYVDSIVVEAKTDISGGITKDHVKEIVEKAVTLPSFRGFTVTGYDVLGNNFYLLVSEDKGHNPFTYVTSNDKFQFMSTLFSTGGMLSAATIVPIDKIAPLIHWQDKSALLTDYQMASCKDTLGVKFSEPVKLINANEPFYFMETVSTNTYAVTVNNVGQPLPDSALFEVVSVTGVTAMTDGDSLWIHETDRVADTLGNAQNNNKNTKRRLYVEKITGSISVNDALYFDNDANGFVDSIHVRATTNIEGGFTEAIIKELVDTAIDLPGFRSFKIDASKLLSKDAFCIQVTEGATNPTTYVTQEDILTVNQMILSGGAKVVAKNIPIKDRVAPIIHWEERSAHAILHQDTTINDTLVVIFSEPMKRVEAEQPFYFRSPPEDKEYQVRLTPFGQPEPEKMLFQINSVSNNVDRMRDGDTLWIHESDRVGDLCKDANGNSVTNFQNNKNNPRRRLYVERRLLPFVMIPKAVSPVDKKNILSKAYKLPGLYDRLLDLDVLKMTTNGSSYYGMMINVVPDNVKNVFESFSLQGRLTILDAVGNKVIDGSDMAWDDDNKRLIWAWSVKNRNGRYVGRGMYLCVIEFEETTKGSENTGLKGTKKILLGVR